MDKQQSRHKSERKRILWFFVILIGFMAIAGYLLLTNNENKIVAGSLPPIGADGVQEVRMSVNGLTYEPSTIPIRSGQKVRWVIDATKAQGCASTMYSKTLGINQALKSGDNVIEFTPTAKGIIRFSCMMGMARGSFQVV